MKQNLESYQIEDKEDKDKDEIVQIEQPQPVHTSPRSIAAQVPRKKIKLPMEDCDN